MNIKLLRKIKRTILARPTQVNMQSWFSSHGARTQRPKGCGTAGCIAGWCVSLARKDKTIRDTINQVVNEDSVPDCAAKELELTYEQQRDLFYSWNWPFQFRRRLELVRTSKAYAQVVADRIDHLIKTGE